MRPRMFSGPLGPRKFGVENFAQIGNACCAVLKVSLRLAAQRRGDCGPAFAQGYGTAGNRP